MKKIIKYDYNLFIFIIIFIFSIISIISISSASLVMGNSYYNLYFKQLIFYILFFIMLIILLRYKDNILVKYTDLIYYFSLFLLLLVLIIGKSINNSRGWFVIGSYSFEPSELMKLALILKLSKELNKNNNDLKKLFVSFIYTIIPFILVLLEPDTGNGIMYLFIFITMCFVSGINIFYFIIILVIGLLFLLTFFYLYNYNLDLFKNIFSSSIYYRVHRITDYIHSSGMQLNNSLISIGSSGVFGNGINNPKIYIPEAYTDFIFPIYVSISGFIGGISLIILYYLFFYLTIKKSLHLRRKDKRVVIGSLIVFIISFTINISMSLGLLPITGIVLPFISYGGSNLFISFLLLYLILKPKRKST